MQNEKIEKDKKGNENRTAALRRIKGYKEGGHLIGNSNTGKLHYSDCSAIGMMREDHKIPTDGDGGHFTPCGWCYPNGYGTFMDHAQSTFEDPIGTEICMDPRINKLFNQVGCLTCGSRDGVVKMFPEDNGVRLLGKKGRWWIYFECSCRYQTALWKAKNRLKIRGRDNEFILPGTRKGSVIP